MVQQLQQTNYRRGGPRYIKGGARIVKLQGGNLFKKIGNFLGGVRGKLRNVVDTVSPTVKKLSPVLLDMGVSLAKNLASQMGKGDNFNFEKSLKGALPGVLSDTASSVGDRFTDKPAKSKKVKKPPHEVVDDTEEETQPAVKKTSKKKTSKKKTQKTKKTKKGGSLLVKNQMQGMPSVLHQLLQG